jgi:hypothetical protein
MSCPAVRVQSYQPRGPPSWVADYTVGTNAPGETRLTSVVAPAYHDSSLSICETQRGQ